MAAVMVSRLLRNVPTSFLVQRVGLWGWNTGSLEGRQTSFFCTFSGKRDLEEWAGAEVVQAVGHLLQSPGQDSGLFLL